MNKKEYLAYLQTEEWKRKARKARERAENRCQLCNSNALLNVHHRTYDRLGHEQDADLIVLCRNCHAKFHDKLETPEQEYDWYTDKNIERAALENAAREGFGRWVELAWYRMLRTFGFSVEDAIEGVSHDLNAGGFVRDIDNRRRQ